MCCSRKKSIVPSERRHYNFLRMRAGSVTQKNLKKCMKLICDIIEIFRGVEQRDLRKIPSMGVVRVFSGITQFCKIMLSLPWYRTLVRGFSTVIISAVGQLVFTDGQNFLNELLY